MTVRIGYQNVLQTAAVVTASTEDTANNGWKENAFDDNPRDWWKTTAGGTQTLTFDLGVATAIDYLHLYSFNLQGGQIALQWSADGLTGWTDIIPAFTPATPVVFKSFASISKRYIRLNATGAAAAILIGFVSVGARLEYANGVQIGFVPVLGQPAKGKANVTADGYPVGSDYVLVPADMIIQADYLTSAEIRSSWMPFFEHAKTGKPFVASWDETVYPNEAAFCWCDPDQAKLPAYVDGKFQRYELRGHALVVN